MLKKRKCRERDVDFVVTTLKVALPFVGEVPSVLQVVMNDHQGKMINLNL